MNMEDIADSFPPEIELAFKKTPLKESVLRDSKRLQQYLEYITLSLTNHKIVKLCGVHVTSARFKAIVEMLVHLLCTPLIYGPADVTKAQLIMMEAFTLLHMTEEMMFSAGNLIKNNNNNNNNMYYFFI